MGEREEVLFLSPCLRVSLFAASPHPSVSPCFAQHPCSERAPRRRRSGQALIYKNVPVEIHMFDHHAGASGYGGKRVVCDVDFEHGVVGKKPVQPL